MYKKLFDKFLKRFFLANGREPQSPREWMSIQDDVVRYINKTKGVPPGPKKPPFQGWSPKVIQGGKKEGIESLLKSGDVKKGVAPKTTKETLKAKKDRGILLRDADEDIARIKRENKQAVKDFKKKFLKKDNVEDVYFDHPDDPRLYKPKKDPDKFQYGGIARVGMAGGGALFKFIEKLFIKASNDIRQGKGKWKGLDQKQMVVQHDNLTKKLTEWEKTGNTEGLEQYFGVNPNEAFAKASKKVKKPKVKWESSGYSKKDMEQEWDFEMKLAKQEMQEDQMIDKALSGMDERQLLKTKYPGISDDLLNKILIDDNPQRKAEVMATMDEYLKLREVGKGEEEAYEIMVKSIKDPKKHAEGGRIGYAVGKIVKGGKWFLNNLRRALKDIEADQGFKNLTPERKEGLTSEIKNLIKSIEGGGPIPDEMIQTIRHDPKFATISKTRSTDPDLYEFEDVILNYGKKGDVVDEQVKILEEFTPTGKGNAEGGRIGMMYGGDPGFAFEYGGSWADWQDKHRDQMPVEQYIKTRLPKDRLPFREMQSGGLAYMLGEPTYMKYGVGGSVGHAPWQKPTAQQQPQQQLDTPQPQVGGAQSPGRGQPNPMKAPRGLPSLAPRTMDPQYMQQQMMQKAMMGQGQPRGQPRMGMDDGGDVYGPSEKEKKEKKKEKEEEEKMRPPETFADPFWRWGLRLPAEEKPGTRVDPTEGIGFDSFGDIDVDMSDPRLKLGKYDPEEGYFPWEFEAGKDSAGITLRKRFDQGGRIGFGLGGFNKARRAFLKMMAGIGGAGIAGGTGLLKLGKAAKVAPKVTEEVIKRGADGMPAYITDLIEVVKAKGTKDFIEGFKKSDYSTVHSYKGVEVIEEAGGATRIKKGQEKSMYGSDEPSYHEVEMEIRPGEYVKDKKGKMIKAQDEYVEYTAKPDMDGKLKDVDEYIDEMDHLELKEIADEAKDLLKIKKASGGVAHLLGE